MECLLHRWSNNGQALASSTQVISLTPAETLCLLTYITDLYTLFGKTNCLKREWPHPTNYIINNCLTPTTQGGETKLKAHLTEGDDSTIYMYTTEQDGSHPGMVLTYFPPLIEASQHSPSRVSTIKLPPSYIPHGQPSNAPIRKSKKTAVIVDPEDNDDVPLASAYLKQK